MFILKNRKIKNLDPREVGEFVGSKISLESILTISIKKMFSSRMNIVKSPRCAERCFTNLFYSLDHKFSLKNCFTDGCTHFHGIKNLDLLFKYRENR